MANYAYKCSACGNVFDLKATIKEKEAGQSEKFACLKCGSKDIKQEFSAVNFIKNIFKRENQTKNCCAGDNACADDGESASLEKDSDEDKKDSCGCGCG